MSRVAVWRWWRCLQTAGVALKPGVKPRCSRDTDSHAQQAERHDDHDSLEHALDVLRYDGSARLHPMCAYALDVGGIIRARGRVG